MKDNELNDYINALIDKSVEAYLMALEIVNKPTIEYRTEGFCFFMSNAWELILKAHIIKDGNDIDKIYYPEKPNNTKRSYSLEKCIKTVWTREKDPIRSTLLFLCEVRNTATHNILPSHDFDNAGVYQQVVQYYNSFLNDKMNISLIKRGIQPFISIAALPSNIAPKSILTLNPETIRIDTALKKQITNGTVVEQKIIVQTRNKDDKADMNLRIAKDGETPAVILREPKDINGKYPYSSAQVISEIKKSLLLYIPDAHFTQHQFTKVISDYNMKEDNNYCYVVNYGNGIPRFSESCITRIATLLFENQDYYESLLPKHKKNR